MTLPASVTDRTEASGVATDTAADIDAGLRQRLRELPKAHLHIHLEGAMRPATLTALCRRYGIERPADTRGRRFDGFGGFLETFWAACDCVRTRDDLARLILELAEDAAAEGVWWIEPAFDAERYSTLRADPDGPPRLFDDQRQGWRFALRAAEAASRQTGVGIGFVSAADRIMPVASAVERARVTARLVGAGEHLIDSGSVHIDGRHAGIVGFGLHGNERGFPPAPFAEAFRIALRDTGLLAVPHAGEIAPSDDPASGAASVADALERLGARRVQHGVLAIHDPALVARLARERDRVCLDVCPTSNLLLNVFPSVADHPLPALLAAGVSCSLGSDDPLLFGANLVDEFVLCRERIGLDETQLASLARASFAHSGAPASLRAAGLAAVDAWLAMPTPDPLQ